MITNQFSLADNAVVCAVTIPASGAAATLLSLVSAVSASLVDKVTLEVLVQQHATSFKWGHDAASCLALCAVDDVLSIPALWALDQYVESTTASPISAVAIIYFRGN